MHTIPETSGLYIRELEFTYVVSCSRTLNHVFSTLSTHQHCRRRLGRDLSIGATLCGVHAGMRSFREVDKNSSFWAKHQLVQQTLRRKNNELLTSRGWCLADERIWREKLYEEGCFAEGDSPLPLPPPQSCLGPSSHNPSLGTYPPGVVQLPTAVGPHKHRASFHPPPLETARASP